MCLVLLAFLLISFLERYPQNFLCLHYLKTSQASIAWHPAPDEHWWLSELWLWPPDYLKGRAGLRTARETWKAGPLTSRLYLSSLQLKWCWDLQKPASFIMVTITLGPDSGKPMEKIQWKLETRWSSTLITCKWLMPAVLYWLSECKNGCSFICTFQFSRKFPLWLTPTQKYTRKGILRNVGPT